MLLGLLFIPWNLEWFCMILYDLLGRICSYVLVCTCFVLTFLNKNKDDTSKTIINWEKVCFSWNLIDKARRERLPVYTEDERNVTFMHAGTLVRNLFLANWVINTWVQFFLVCVQKHWRLKKVLHAQTVSQRVNPRSAFIINHTITLGGGFPNNVGRRGTSLCWICNCLHNAQPVRHQALIRSANIEWGLWSYYC